VIQALVVGAVTGLALFLLIFALIPRRVGLARRVAAFDAGRTPAGHGALRPASYPGDGKESAFSKRLGAALARFCANRAGNSVPFARTSTWWASRSRTTSRPRSCWPCSG